MDISAIQYIFESTAAIVYTYIITLHYITLHYTHSTCFNFKCVFLYVMVSLRMVNIRKNMEEILYVSINCNTFYIMQVHLFVLY
jgi:hypothetical protein